MRVRRALGLGLEFMTYKQKGFGSVRILSVRMSARYQNNIIGNVRYQI